MAADRRVSRSFALRVCAAHATIKYGSRCTPQRCVRMHTPFDCAARRFARTRYAAQLHTFRRSRAACKERDVTMRHAAPHMLTTLRADKIFCCRYDV